MDNRPKSEPTQIRERLEGKAHCVIHNSFYDPDKYKMCYHCAMIDRGFKLCEKCSKQYHNPKFEKCFQCSDFNKNKFDM